MSTVKETKVNNSSWVYINLNGCITAIPKEELDKEFNDIKNFINSSSVNLKTKNNIPSFDVSRADKYNFEVSKSPLKLNSGKELLDNKTPYFINSSPEPNIIKIDGEDIDLNKLPLKMRKLLIANVLERKNFD